jgi:hypothetical protein
MGPRIYSSGYVGILRVGSADLMVIAAVDDELAVPLRSDGIYAREAERHLSTVKSNTRLVPR